MHQLTFVTIEKHNGISRTNGLHKKKTQKVHADVSEHVDTIDCEIQVSASIIHFIKIYVNRSEKYIPVEDYNSCRLYYRWKGHNSTCTNFVEQLSTRAVLFCTCIARTGLKPNSWGKEENSFKLYDVKT